MRNATKRNQGALKAQLLSAQGSALGNATHLSISAPCKGNYIKFEGLKHGKVEVITPFLSCATPL